MPDRFMSGVLGGVGVATVLGIMTAYWQVVDRLDNKYVLNTTYELEMKDVRDALVYQSLSEHDERLELEKRMLTVVIDRIESMYPDVSKSNDAVRRIYKEATTQVTRINDTLSSMDN